MGAIYNSLIQKEEGKDKMTVDQSIYRKNIINKIDKQIQKGIDKYGTTLEQNNWLKTIDRIVYLQEELIDALVYSEHIIAKLKELNLDLENDNEDLRLEKMNLENEMISLNQEIDLYSEDLDRLRKENEELKKANELLSKMWNDVNRKLLKDK